MVIKFNVVGSFNSLFNSCDSEFEFDKFDELIHPYSSVSPPLEPTFKFKPLKISLLLDIYSIGGFLLKPEINPESD